VAGIESDAVRRGSEFLDLQEIVAGRYSLEREIGRGGMGVVFLARDVALERPVAMKLLPRHLAQDPALRERFLREARTAAQLMHPNIVPIHAVETHDDIVFFVMAFVEGETLAERVQRKGVLSGHDAARLMQEVAWALGYAHGRGVIHRDIKPDNILIEHASGRAMVADFGIARVAARDTLSTDGSFVGTVQYMSPEQAGSEPLDARSDIYSLGATTYFALTGSSPVEAPSMPAMITRLMTEEPVAVASLRTDVSTALSGVVTRALAKNRAERFETADGLAMALQQSSGDSYEIRPEVRTLLREVTSGKAVLVVSLVLVLSGMIALSTGAVIVAGVVSLLGLAGLGIFASAVGGAILQLRRDRVPWSDVERGISREVADLEAQTLRMLETKRSLRQIYTMMGALLTGVGGFGAFVGFAILGIANILRHPFDLDVRMTAASIFSGILGVVLLRAGLSKKPLPKWLAGGQRREGSVDDVSFRLIRQLMRLGPLSRFYARGLAPSAKPTASALPTATLLLQRVEELVAQLPDALRTRLGDVVPAAAALERAIAALRTRLEQIDRSLAELPVASPARNEFTAARERTAARFAECIGALERVRTDLLRLGAGLIAADGITAELEKAQELSAAIDAELYGLDEVRRIGTAR
jgi:predicted Ser/Thr protein kinase